MALKNSIALSTTIPQDFDINYNARNAEFSTDFATAYETKTRNPQNDKAEYYALVYDKAFPADLDRLHTYKRVKDKNIQEMVDFGKVPGPKGESLAAVFKKPIGEKLSNLIKRGPLEENFVLQNIFRQVASAIHFMHENNIMHGNINPDYVYMNPANAAVTLRECVSEFVGFSQRPIYETLERMVCHPAGKSHREYPADYFACGVFVADVISGGNTILSVADEVARRAKFENGSFEAILAISRSRMNNAIQPKTELLLRGLLHDKTKERWQTKQITNWQRKENTQPAPSRVHRQANAPYTFNEVEYFSPKYLTYMIQNNWVQAKKELKMPDLIRWISYTSRLPDIDKRLSPMIMRAGQMEVIVPDEKIARILYILDDEGPIRFKDISFHPDSLGNIFAYFMMTNDAQHLENLITAIGSGYVEGWIANQDNQDMYKPNVLGYHPRKIKNYLRKTDMGFGVERCLYELNPYLPCLSPLLENTYSLGLPTVLTVLNQPNRLTGKNMEDDKHLIAYICAQTDIEDVIKIRSLQRFPYFNKSVSLKILAMFAVAQQKTGIDKLLGIATWFRQNLAPVVEKFSSVSFRRKITENLDAAVATGNLQKVFQAITDTRIIAKDANGFEEAKRTFKVLNYEMLKLQSQDNLDQLAYRMGLRVAVIFAYLICTVAILSVVFFNFSGKH